MAKAKVTVKYRAKKNSKHYRRCNVCKGTGVVYKK